MGAEIIIVDDDPMVGELTQDLLQQAGFSTHLVRDSRTALDEIREQAPKLVLLDILMPGIDGLSLLRQIKQDPGFSGVKVAVISGKKFSAEIDRARGLGADAFIPKPYKMEEFPQRIAELIGPPSSSAPEAPAKRTLRVKVWGSATPDSTPCLSLEAFGRLFILDAGAGIVPLGEEVLREGKYKEAWLLLSHFHADHVSGLGLFPCLRERGFELRVLGPREPESSLSELLENVLKSSFERAPRPITAKLTLHELREETYELASGLRVSAFYANHPSTTLGYALDLAGRKIVYCPDGEIYGESATALQDYDEKLGRLCRGAQLLIHDARYNEADYAAHADQGHSSALAAAAFAAENEVSRLLLFHADTKYSAQELEALEKSARDVLESKGARIPCQLAKDGLVLEI